MFDREKQGAYALEVEARDGAPSARPNSNQQPNSGKYLLIYLTFFGLHKIFSSMKEFLFFLSKSRLTVLRQIAKCPEGALIKTHDKLWHSASLKYMLTST